LKLKKPDSTKRNNLPAAKETQQHIEFHSGPLPPPETLYKYNQLNPGFADRIFDMAEREAAQRHQLEITSLTAEIAES